MITLYYLTLFTWFQTVHSLFFFFQALSFSIEDCILNISWLVKILESSSHIVSKESTFVMHSLRIHNHCALRAYQKSKSIIAAILLIICCRNQFNFHRAFACSFKQLKLLQKYHEIIIWNKNPLNLYLLTTLIFFQELFVERMMERAMLVISTSKAEINPKKSVLLYRQLYIIHNILEYSDYLATVIPRSYSEEFRLVLW